MEIYRLEFIGREAGSYLVSPLVQKLKFSCEHESLQILKAL